MNWAVGIRNAVDYIEEHITDELDFEKIAAQAACSPFYFQRIFGMLCGIPLGEYIRNRRMTLAGSEIASAEDKIIDIALKYGYESPESFARAFTRFHGITPSEARRDGSKLKSFSPLRVRIYLKGGNTMNYKIMENQPFRVLEKAERHTVDDNRNLNTIPEFWQRAKNDGTIKTLLQNAADRTYLYGICYNNEPTDNKTFDYAIAVLCDENTVAPDGYRIREIPGGTWIAAECTGAMPDAIQNLWHELCAEFFPSSGYEPTYELDIEVYPDGDMSSPEYKSEIRIPIKK